MLKEAHARIKINKMLEKAGWRLFDDKNGKANVQLESNIKIRQKDIDDLGADFEKTKDGRADYLLLDENNFPLAILEAKSEDKDPLDGKEQARKYAEASKARFIILSNGTIHYFWDLEIGDPTIINQFPTQEQCTPEFITQFPTQESLKDKQTIKPKKFLWDEEVRDDYIVLTQNPNFKDDPRYVNEETRPQYLLDISLQFLRPYQLEAVHALQNSAKSGNTRFLFEMATGTGKTLISAAIIKLFLKTGNAKRVLFLVDRLELESQAYRNFDRYLKNDFISIIYKKDRNGWRKAEIVIATVQSLLSQNKYKFLFSPTDFDLIISDEAHRSIGGNSRAVFEYFTGYKLGLTATPKDYLKNIDIEKLATKDPRSLEKRQLLDTYKTFGCDNVNPTFRFNIEDAVNGGYLISPFVIDARTEVTTQLLSEKGYAVIIEDDSGAISEKLYFQQDYEKRLFSPDTNRALCESFIENCLKDPISGEVGKSIIFCISQNHASKITQLLNQMATAKWPGKYNSDFAMRITSNIDDSQNFAVHFAHNNLNGYTRFLEGYKTSKTRVCITVGMMTTGYDCPDILNIVLMRPIFSPTDFIQIKGRGTRKWNFEYTDTKGEKYKKEKERFRIIDFFAVFDYFEHDYDYDAIKPLPPRRDGIKDPIDPPPPPTDPDIYTIETPDRVITINEIDTLPNGMKVDRELFGKYQAILREDKELKSAVDDERWEKAIQIARDKYENKPELYITLETIRKSQSLDREITWKEFLECIFDIIPAFKSKDEKLEDVCEQFFSIHKPQSQVAPHIKNFIKAYLGDKNFRKIIDKKDDIALRSYQGITSAELGKLKRNGWLEKVIAYAMDYATNDEF